MELLETSGGVAQWSLTLVSQSTYMKSENCASDAYRQSIFLSIISGELISQGLKEALVSWGL